MCEAQQGAGVVPLRAIQEEGPASPACSVSSDCDWGPYKRSEGQGWSVVLRQSRRGFKCHAIIDALLPVSPSAAYDILIDPEIKQWRGVKECTYRKVWEDDGNIQRVEIEQTAMVFFKTIYTRMHVLQDRAAGTMQFALAKSGMMKVCEGQWTVSAVEGNSQAAHVHLEQMMQPGFAPPPPFKRFMRKAMVNKASQMLIQLQEEAERSATSAAAPAGKPGQLSTQPSFDIVAFAGPAAAASLAAAPEQPAQPGHDGRAAPGSAPAAAAAAPPPPTDALFARWQRIVSPVQPSAAHQGVRSHPISFDPECAVES